MQGINLLIKACDVNLVFQFKLSQCINNNWWKKLISWDIEYSPCGEMVIEYFVFPERELFPGDDKET